MATLPPCILDEEVKSRSRRATHSYPGSTRLGTDAECNQVSVMTMMSGWTDSHRAMSSAIFFRTDRALVCNMEIDDAGSAEEDVVVKRGVEDGRYVLLGCEENDAQVGAEVIPVIRTLEDDACKEPVPVAGIDENVRVNGIDIDVDVDDVNVYVDVDEGMALVGGEEIHVREDVIAGEEQ